MTLVHDRMSLRCGILTDMPAAAQSIDSLKIAEFLLLIMGWLLVLSAIVLLKQTALGAFITAGLGVETLGLVLTVRSHIASNRRDTVSLSKVSNGN